MLSESKQASTVVYFMYMSENQLEIKLNPLTMGVRYTFGRRLPPVFYDCLFHQIFNSKHIEKICVLYA